MVPWGWLSFRVVDCPWHCGPFSSLGHQVLLDKRSLLQPGVAGLHLQPWVEDPTPATYSSSLWVSSTSPGMDMVGRALRSTCRSCMRSGAEFLLRGTCNGTGHEVAMLCRETAWGLSALYSERNVTTQGREPFASTEKWKTLISLLESWEVSFLLVHRRMWQRHNMHLQGTMQASVPLITVDGTWFLLVHALPTAAGLGMKSYFLDMLLKQVLCTTRRPLSVPGLRQAAAIQSPSRKTSWLQTWPSSLYN